jgi:transposase
VDGYAVYKELARGHAGEILLAFCLAHSRRGFVKVYKSTNSPFAREVIEQIAAIYAIEAEIRGTSAQRRLEARQLRSRPLMDALKTRLTEVVDQLSSQSPLTEAINYMLNHWNGLTLFLTDGRVEVDSNTVERSMRPIALGRNYAKLWIMRSPVPDFRPTDHFEGSGLRIISEALKELHQLIRSSIPREAGCGRLQLT